MTACPSYLTESSDMPDQLRERSSALTAALTPLSAASTTNVGTPDPLSDVLRAVRLNGAHFYYVEAAAPWSVLTVPAVELVPRILPNAEHLISYHIIVSGTCWGGPLG